jgi:hypothetical protein
MALTVRKIRFIAILAEVHQWFDRRIYQVICLIIVGIMQLLTNMMARLASPLAA